MKAKNSISSTNLNSYSFNIVVIKCSITKVFTGSTTQNYDVGDGSVICNYATTLFYSTNCTGKTISLSAKLADGSTLPTWIVFNSALPSFTVATSTPGDANVYNLKIIATLNDGVSTKDETATLTLTVSSCTISKTWTPTSTTHAYTVGDATKTIDYSG